METFFASSGFCFLMLAWCHQDFSFVAYMSNVWITKTSSIVVDVMLSKPSPDPMLIVSCIGPGVQVVFVIMDEKILSY